jgi:predicted kinase
LPQSDLIIYGESIASCARSILPRAKCATSKSRLAFVIGQNSSSVSLRGVLRAWFASVVAFLLLSGTLCASAPAPEQCVPIRWTGGPLELEWRAHTKTLPADNSVRDALTRWYEPATIGLLEDSPVNCLLVTWSAATGSAVEAEQRRLVKAYTEVAHKHGLAVLGLVYAAGDASKIVADAIKASLDGLVLDGDFAWEFRVALRKAAGSVLVIEITKDAAAWRWKSEPIVAVAGVAPSGHNLSEMGIRGTPSSQPWIESNIWLVRSFATPSSRLVWISSQLESPSPIDYERAAADAFAAGGRWIISLDDALRTKLRAHDASAREIWSRLSTCLKYADSHTAWHALASYGNVGIVLDSASAQPDRVDEYLKLATRRQVPYQLISRSELNGTVMKFRAIVATELDPPSATERKLLQDFAENGGIVFAAPSWGNAPQKEPFVELPTGKGSVIVYKDPDPDALARDLKEMLSDDDLGVVPFNVPSVISFVSGGAPGQPLLVQLVNYFDHPVEAITIRVSGKFKSARMETLEGTAVDLPLRYEERRTEVTIPKLLLWGTVSMQ